MAMPENIPVYGWNSIREWEVENKGKDYIQIIIFDLSKKKKCKVWVSVRTEIECMD